MNEIIYEIEEKHEPLIITDGSESILRIYP